MFEHKTRPLLPRKAFLLRFSRWAASAAGVVLGSLVVGAVGYRTIEGMRWVDAFLNASMILTGMGPAAELKTDAGKIFAACYALYSGIVFLTASAMIFGPLGHRFLHRFHLELDESETARPRRPETR